MTKTEKALIEAQAEAIARALAPIAASFASLAAEVQGLKQTMQDGVDTARQNRQAIEKRIEQQRQTMGQGSPPLIKRPG